ncbi:tRNA (cytidine(34)-2'-O)-methyltransferase [Helicobacter sp. 23-1045]
MLNIVLHEPRIPHNTGNIGRLCLALNARLHLIYPLGFTIDDKHLKRAGMDYFEKISLVKWDNFGAFERDNPIDLNHFFLSTKANRSYFEARFADGCFLHFGREDKGLPLELINAHFAQTYKIPMQNNARSLNLSNAVSIVAYEVVRQNMR